MDHHRGHRNCREERSKEKRRIIDVHEFPRPKKNRDRIQNQATRLGCILRRGCEETKGARSTPPTAPFPSQRKDAEGRKTTHPCLIAPSAVSVRAYPRL